MKQGLVARLLLSSTLRIILLFGIHPISAQYKDCIQISSWKDISEAITSIQSRKKLVLCPFSISHEGGINEGLDIVTTGLIIICMRISQNQNDATNPEPKCVVTGGARHFNVIADDVTFVGIDFLGSRNGAVVVGSGVTNFSLLQCSFSGNLRSLGDHRDGGALELLPNSKMTFISQCTFERNSAPGGGAVSATNSQITLYASMFTSNEADEKNGGGIIINFEEASRESSNLIAASNTFIHNTATLDGSAIYSTTEVCDGGRNFACSNESANGATCDGTFLGNSCTNFSQACKPPTVIPTMSPIPSLTPSDPPSLLPTAHPSSRPTSIPSDGPSAAPSSIPSMYLRASPSYYPTETPSSGRSGAPSDIQSYKLSSLPTFLPSIRPSNPNSKFPISISSSLPTNFPSPSSSLPPSKTSDNSSIEPTLIPTSLQGPTISIAPSAACYISPILRRTEILNKINKMKHFNKKSFENEESPQSVALQWILEKDRWRSCPYDANLVQRFIIGFFYLSMQISIEELNTSHECTWDNIVCDENMVIHEIKFDTARLSGTLPPELSILTGLTLLSLENQKNIVESVPKDYSKLVDLKILDLDKNYLTGPFPQELTTMSELESLDINFNSFSGGIEFLSSYKKLKFAHLDNNYFRGTIPESLGEMTELLVLSLHHNLLSGTMPDSICHLMTKNGGNLVYLLADCRGETPAVTCSCCTHCL